MLSQLSNKRVLTITMSLTSREHPKRYGSIVDEFYSKESSKQLVLNKEKTSIRLT